MRSVFTILFFFFILPAIIFAQDNGAAKNMGAKTCAVKKMNSKLPVLADKAYLPHSFNVLDYKINLDIYSCFISPYTKAFTGSVTLTLAVDSSISSINLDAVNTSIQVNSVGLAAASFTHANNVLKITLNRTYAVGETLQVKVNYQHLNTTDGAVNVAGGLFFTDCEPEGARCWFPCWDKPSDKATVDVTARVPSSVKLGSNGRLADSTKTGDTIYYHWISRDPVATYLVVVIGKVNYNLDIVYWNKLSDPNVAVPMRFYYNSGETPQQMEQLIGPLTTFYSQKFCEHPFEKNGFATLNSQFAWGGMENQTLTTLCPGCWSTNLITHEFAHQWFGDMITCATWADITLNEGFATYCEALWDEHASGYATYRSDIEGDASDYISSNPGWPIYNPSWAVTTPNTNTLFNYAITYAKGACVLHQLRFVMGDDLFFQGLQTYVNNPDLRFKSAVLEDLKNAMSQVYGSDLSWFFDSWYKQANHPTYTNKYYIQSAGTNRWLVGFVASQSTTPYFKMVLPIKVSFSNGTDTLIKVLNTYNGQQFLFSFAKQPSSVTFDPNNDIVLKSATLSTITGGPVLTSPANNTTGLSQSVTLNWGAVTSATNYKLIVAKEPEFTTIILADSSLTGTTRTLTSLDNQSRYYWKVTAKVSSTWTPWSETWNFTVGSNCKDISLQNGWNIVSLPNKPGNLTATAIFPAATSSIFAYNNGYSIATTLQNGSGYWVRYPSTTTVSVCGDPINVTTVPVIAGWNLIGIYQNDVQVNQITSTPAGIVSSFYYGFQASYSQANTLQSGKGYWVKVTQNGVLNLPVSTAKISDPVQQSSNNSMILFADAAGNSSSLLIGADRNYNYELPPLPPAGVYDVRYANNSRSMETNSSALISLQGVNFPLTITARNANIELFGNNNLIAKLENGKSAVLTDSRFNQIEVKAEKLDMNYSLSQNYPNPFNPSTKISYQIPAAAHVTLKVYDVLGNLVAQLVDKTQAAGQYEITFSADHLSSGIYFYEIHAGQFNAVKKMTYLR